MNRKQLTILLVLVAVIGGIGLLQYNKKSESYKGSTRAGQKVLADFDLNDVGAISIKQDTKEVNLARENDRWVVKERNSYAANFEQIADVLRKMHDLKVVQTMPASPSQLAKLQLAETGKGDQAPTIIHLKSASGKELQKISLGMKMMRKSERESQFGEEEGGWPVGRYILPSGAQSIAVVSDPLTTAEPKPESWLNKDFFKVEKVNSVSVTYPAATNSWQLSRESETGGWTLAAPREGEVLDTNKLYGVASALANPSFTDVVVEPKPEVTGLDTSTVITLTTFDKFTYTLNVGNKTPEDNHYVTMSVKADIAKERATGKDEKPEDKERLDKEFKERNSKLEEKLKEEQQFAKWTYLVPRWTMEALLKNRSELMVDPKKDDPTTASEDESDDPVTAEAEEAEAGDATSGAQEISLP